jgi:FkbM family methyltransferase
MRRRLSQHARSGAHRLLRRLGVDLVRYAPAHFANLRRMEILDRHGVTLVVDAGANVGNYARMLRADGYRGRILSIEPLSTAFAELSRSAADDERWVCRRVALGDAEGVAEINVAGNSWSSSLLPMSSRHARVAPESVYVATEEVELTTLDALLRPLVGDDDRIFLKLDLQGFELPALRGAHGRMQQVVGGEIELSYVPLYEGQALLAEVVTFLSASGLDLVSLEEVLAESQSGELLQVDGLFVRRSA